MPDRSSRPGQRPANKAPNSLMAARGFVCSKNSTDVDRYNRPVWHITASPPNTPSKLSNPRPERQFAGTQGFASVNAKTPTTWIGVFTEVSLVASRGIEPRTRGFSIWRSFLLKQDVTRKTFYKRFRWPIRNPAPLLGTFSGCRRFSRYPATPTND